MTPNAPRPVRRLYDTFHMGRSCINLYSNDVGAAFVHIKRFTACRKSIVQGLTMGALKD